METYVLSNALTAALSKLKHVPLHFLRIRAEPTVGVEIVSIFAEDGFHKVEGGGIHANPVLNLLASFHSGCFDQRTYSSWDVMTT